MGSRYSRCGRTSSIDAMLAKHDPEMTANKKAGIHRLSLEQTRVSGLGSLPEGILTLVLRHARRYVDNQNFLDSLVRVGRHEHHPAAPNHASRLLDKEIL
ncbi:hypothetical protein BN2475_630033 [Paraburkholderia ribeironis]|uniref:Uncharacterized protein n=1 Tax=Paraburkholderia ribeironis TaxID=1247936 RepID=A0A1N7SFJ6_9BURK|nr:hypothetical protein BN2475_630033 [Paraburkholderia ribeironis]